MSSVSQDFRIPVQDDKTCVEKLAQLFPESSPVRIVVRVSSTRPDGRMLQEQTVIEFGTSREVLFATALPLDFEECVRLRNSDGSLDTAATIVAVRYHSGRKAVAARFTEKIDNWIIKP